MIKGVLLALGIMLVLALIPVVDLVGLPFGPFIGAYYGMRYTGAGAAPSIGASAVRAARFGALLGLLVLLMLVAVAVGLTVSIDLGQQFVWLLWLGVFVFSMYAATMAALGAMYSQLKAADREPEGKSDLELGRLS